MSDVIAVLNAGSSSMKFTFYEDRGKRLHVLADGQVEGLLHGAALQGQGLGRPGGSANERGLSGTQLGQRGRRGGDLFLVRKRRVPAPSG